MKEPADIFTLPARNDKDQTRARSKATARPRCAICSPRSRARRQISLERFIFALGMRQVGETTALALARGYGSWEAFHDACLKVAKGDEEAIAEMDALDQIGDTVIASIKAYFGESHNRGIVERLTREVTILDAEKPKSNSQGRRQDRGLHRLAGEDDARRGQGHRRAAWRQGRRLGVEKDRLCRRRSRRRLETRRGQEARRHRADRGRVAAADRASEARSSRHARSGARLRRTLQQHSQTLPLRPARSAPR